MFIGSAIDTIVQQEGYIQRKNERNTRLSFLYKLPRKDENASC
jgi:hypothetical protein